MSTVNPLPEIQARTIRVVPAEGGFLVYACRFDSSGRHVSTLPGRRVCIIAADAAPHLDRAGLEGRIVSRALLDGHSLVDLVRGIDLADEALTRVVESGRPDALALISVSWTLDAVSVAGFLGGLEEADSRAPAKKDAAEAAEHSAAVPARLAPPPEEATIQAPDFAAVATVTETIDAPLEVVWAHLTETASWPRWWHCQRLERVDPGWVTGGLLLWADGTHAQIVRGLDEDPKGEGRRLVFDGAVDGGEIRRELSVKESGEATELAHSLLVRPPARAPEGHDGMRAALQRFKQVVEDPRPPAAAPSTGAGPARAEEGMQACRSCRRLALVEPRLLLGRVVCPLCGALRWRLMLAKLGLALCSAAAGLVILVATFHGQDSRGDEGSIVLPGLAGLGFLLFGLAIVADTFTRAAAVWRFLARRARQGRAA